MKAIIVAIVFCTALISCGDKVISPSSSSQSNDYFPLQVGNTWKYFLLIGADTIDFCTETVESTRELGGKTYFALSKVWSVRIHPLEVQSYYRVEDGKVYTYIDKKDSLYIDFVNNNTSVGHVYSTNDNVPTKVGVFNKVKYIGWPASPVDGAPVNGYAPGIGLISSVIEGPSYELVYAKIGGKVYE